MKTCLAVDIGNTSTKLAVCVDGRVRKTASLLAAEELPRAVDAAIRNVVRTEQMDGAIVASVVPGRTDSWRTAVRRATLCHPVTLTDKCRLNVRLDYPRPATLGADRIAGVCGAFLKFGGPVLVADIGTAATLDLVTRDGRFIGGAIAPGPVMMLRALSQQTALLPAVEWGTQTPSIGTTTESAMQMGVRAGYAAFLDALVEKLSLKAGRSALKLCATGGQARMAIEGSRLSFSIEPHLTIEGMAHVWRLNS
jgi:type III pantothenate kinase